jgi:hypothetical protein
MNRNAGLLLLLLLLLGGAYAYWFTDWMRPPQIQIEVVTRPLSQLQPEAEVLPTVFTLDREYQLTGLRLLAVSNLPGAAPAAAPLWQLRAKDGSKPTRGFHFGETLAGMEAVVPAPRLFPGGTYRLEVEAGRLRGQRDFTAQAAPPPAAE